MRTHRFRLAAAGVLTALVATTATVTVTTTPAQAAECNINSPGNLCYSAKVLLEELIADLRDRADELADDVVRIVEDCRENDPNSACAGADNLVQVLIQIAGQVLVIVLDAAGDARGFADEAIAAALLIVNDQLAQLRAIADEVAGPYIDLVEGVVTDLTTLLTGAVPTSYSVQSSSHPRTGYRVDIARACTGTTERGSLLPPGPQTVHVAGAAVANTTPTGVAVLTRFTKLQCLIQRVTPNGNETLATFERTLANPFSVVTGSAAIPAGAYFVCARGEVTLTNGDVVAFADC